ncbi:MAG: hypothetical protein L6R37_005133 [Teloschistes peruensis]|nr:MAG: hypothetical protein L6R37_005133 [Teloschistes peruensis]
MATASIDQEPKATPGPNQCYMKDNTGSLLIDGASGGHGGFASGHGFACSRKEVTTPKTQPWKAHWSPKDAPGANQAYMEDDNGLLLIDGVCVGDPACELTCSRQAEL